MTSAEAVLVKKKTKLGAMHGGNQSWSNRGGGQPWPGRTGATSEEKAQGCMMTTFESQLRRGLLGPAWRCPAVTVCHAGTEGHLVCTTPAAQQCLAVPGGRRLAPKQRRPACCTPRSLFQTTPCSSAGTRRRRACGPSRKLCTLAALSRTAGWWWCGWDRRMGGR